MDTRGDLSSAPLPEEGSLLLFCAYPFYCGELLGAHASTECRKLDGALSRMALNVEQLTLGAATDQMEEAD